MKEKINIYTGIFTVFIVICFIIGIASLSMGMQYGTAYYLGLLLLIPFGFITWYIYYRINSMKMLMDIRENWGKKKERKRNFSEISSFFITAKHDDVFLIDDQTFGDLNMDDVFAVLDRTFTEPGSSVLYNMLRTLIFNGGLLEKRRDAIYAFQKDQDLREKVAMCLYKLGRQRQNDTVSFLWGEMPALPPIRILYNILAYAAFLSPLMFLILGGKALVYVIAPIFIVNLSIHYKVKGKIMAELSSIRYVTSMIRASYRIGKIKYAEKECNLIKEYVGILKKYASVCKGIAKKSGYIAPLGLDSIYEYVNIFYLKEVRNFYSAVNDIKKYRNILQDMYIKIGEIDALLSVASYRADIKYVEPVLKNEGAFIYAENIRHPLLNDPVPNSIAINKEGIIVTGSNMSGKSTFLRTLAINAVFAQTICTCLASSYDASFLRVMTSISRSDNIIGGKSYYLAEVEALLRIIKESGKEIPLLCIIDELFRGTNSVERISASAQILKYLVERNTLVIIATHDLELTKLVGNLYECYYFSERMEAKGLNFDFKLKRGVSQNRNAVKLMKYLGYPEEIINGTNEIVNGMIANMPD
ncbi:MAG: MutS family DNA mismatch repair protein [Clostridiales bacterium]|nr:MutS family DNA mismatch repair protein [Clostridiales bacterium]